MSESRLLRIGTAGWSIPAEMRGHFSSEGSALSRYSEHLGAAEINSSFYRPHRVSTYERWRASVPASFRFSIKVPKSVTHALKLVDTRDLLTAFADQAGALDDRLGVVLVQLPPSLAFDRKIARLFFRLLRELIAAPIVCEPRHLSWFTVEVDRFLVDQKVARVAADPALCPEAALPGGWRGIRYYRLHGSPHMYRSSYASKCLRELAHGLGHTDDQGETWVIFDNTAAGQALPNAMQFAEFHKRESPIP